MNDLLIKKVSLYIRKYDLLPKFPGKIIVGVSGGVDSSVLLYVLYRLGYNCQAAHCNFHLRGKESLRDEIQACSLAYSMNMNFFKKDFNTWDNAKKKKISLEMAARELRYEWFENLRQEQNAEVIAVAHHRLDNIETLLLNLIRGTGIRGLVGIKFKNKNVVRPLLCISKQEIVQFAIDNKIVYITDSSNFKEVFKRNKIRFKLLPLLRTLNPSIDQTLLYVIRNLEEVAKIYDAHIKIVKNDVFNSNTGIIDIKKLRNLPSPESVLFEILKEYGFNRNVVYSITRAIEANNLSGKVFCTSGYLLIKNRDQFLLVPRNENDENKIYKIDQNEKRITIPTKMEICYEDVRNDFKIECDSNIAYFDIKKLQFPLQLRKWRNGDKFIPFGMRNFQKLSDYFSNHKFSRLEKKNIWILCSGDDIIWIVGERIDHRYRICSLTKKAVIFKYFG
ncbi:MAG: tRNA lysidine(34) synthetase TilS [Bacteroidales bacterium OttesenSCG-928-I14]|nr:tRNA lysidine(34) synthetase TilS [Bacteroidales bacterium OttesenSCG-928-I14]